MCGICGYAGIHEPHGILDSMLSRLAHRGPDNTGKWQNRHASLGHSRLSIVDITDSGNQPMSNEDGSILLVGNGEIYNYSELRSFLEKKGHHFKSASDNEVLLHLYEEKEKDFLPLLNGMIAFAIWDSSRQKLLLGRDRLGIKPLYYYHDDDFLIFASEIKALLACPQVSTGIDPEGLIQYLTFENTFGPVTLHRNIKMIEPGQYLIWEKGRITSGTYWYPQFHERQDITIQSARNTYTDVVQRSVKRHLMSDVEVASYLSSGFDSSTVTYYAKPRLTFTGNFGKRGWYDENTGAEMVALSVKARHNSVEINGDSLEQTMDDLIYALDEPRMGTGSFSQYMVARQAAKHVKVILTGHGGDELFAGYPIFKLISLMQQFKGSALKASYETIFNTRISEWPHFVYFLLRRHQHGDGNFFLPVIFPKELLAKGLHAPVYNILKEISPEKGLQRAIGDEQDLYKRLTLTYLRAYLPGLFVVEDKISMAHSLESRTPLCDNELLDFALTIPLSLKLHNNQLKAIPKMAMQGKLPVELYSLPKRGFPTPLASWLRGRLAEWLRKRLLDQTSPLNSLFANQFLKNTVEQYMTSWRRNYRPLDEIATHRIWALLSLDSWLRNSEERFGITLRIN